MSQIDKLVYIPLIFWFILLFIILYFIIFCYILGFFYYNLRTRTLLYNNLVDSSLNLYNFLKVSLFFCIDLFSDNFFSNIYLYFRKNWNIYTLKVLKKKYYII